MAGVRCSASMESAIPPHKCRAGNFVVRIEIKSQHGTMMGLFWSLQDREGHLGHRESNFAASKITVGEATLKEAVIRSTPKPADSQ